MGKMFQNASSLKPLGQLKPNCPGIIIWRSSNKFGFFMPIRNPRWLPSQVMVLTQDHMGKYINNFFSEAIALIEPKLCINHWKVLYKLRVFYVDRNSKMTTTVGHSFYIGPIGSFYKQVNDTGSWEPLVYLKYFSKNTCNQTSSLILSRNHMYLFSKNERISVFVSKITFNNNLFFMRFLSSVIHFQWWACDLYFFFLFEGCVRTSFLCWCSYALAMCSAIYFLY